MTRMQRESAFRVIFKAKFYLKVDQAAGSIPEHIQDGGLNTGTDEPRLSSRGGFVYAGVR